MSLKRRQILKYHNRPTIKVAVFEAIFRCQSINPSSRCMVKNINDSVVTPAEAQKWRSQYDKEINNYLKSLRHVTAKKSKIP